MTSRIKKSKKTNFKGKGRTLADLVHTKVFDRKSERIKTAVVLQDDEYIQIEDPDAEDDAEDQYDPHKNEINREVQALDNGERIEKESDGEAEKGCEDADGTVEEAEVTSMAATELNKARSKEEEAKLKTKNEISQKDDCQESAVLGKARFTTGIRRAQASKVIKRPNKVPTSQVKK
ncbi:hypothetical protein NX059_010486 [Plenodomus lindquistii]|nr:hypothetical protein NX059_010486 [Plenodomus lindquistii]